MGVAVRRAEEDHNWPVCTYSFSSPTKSQGIDGMNASGSLESGRYRQASDTGPS